MSKSEYGDSCSVSIRAYKSVEKIKLVHYEYVQNTFKRKFFLV